MTPAQSTALQDFSDEILARVLWATGLEPTGIHDQAGPRASARAWRDPFEAERLGHRRAVAADPSP